MSDWLHIAGAAAIIAIVAFIGGRSIRREDARQRVADSDKGMTGRMPAIADELALRRARKQPERAHPPGTPEAG